MQGATSTSSRQASQHACIFVSLLSHSAQPVHAAGQRDCPFGDAVLAFNDCTVASETCEELFTPAAQNIALALAGVDIITNGSGSHHQVCFCSQLAAL